MWKKPKEIRIKLHKLRVKRHHVCVHVRVCEGTAANWIGACEKKKKNPQGFVPTANVLKQLTFFPLPPQTCSKWFDRCEETFFVSLLRIHSYGEGSVIVSLSKPPRQLIHVGSGSVFAEDGAPLWRAASLSALCFPKELSSWNMDNKDMIRWQP